MKKKDNYNLKEAEKKMKDKKSPKIENIYIKRTPQKDKKERKIDREN